MTRSLRGGSFGSVSLEPARAGLDHDGAARTSLDKLVGRERFRFAGFPLRICGGRASPIRAVAIFE